MANIWPEILTDEQVEEFRAAFEMLDVKGTGKVSINQLSGIIKSIDPTAKRSDINSMKKLLDKDGEFGFEDFVTVLAFRMRQADLEEDLQKAFKIFDRDGDGYITVKELRYLMTNLGERYTEEEVTEMIREVDLDCKGKVDFHGRSPAVQSTSTVTEWLLNCILHDQSFSHIFRPFSLHSVDRKAKAHVLESRNL